jgi:hypothetical protein
MTGDEQEPSIEELFNRLTGDRAARPLATPRPGLRSFQARLEAVERRAGPTDLLGKLLREIDGTSRGLPTSANRACK